MPEAPRTRTASRTRAPRARRTALAAAIVLLASAGAPATAAEDPLAAYVDGRDGAPQCVPPVDLSRCPSEQEALLEALSEAGDVAVEVTLYAGRFIAAAADHCVAQNISVYNLCKYGGALILAANPLGAVGTATAATAGGFAGQAALTDAEKCVLKSLIDASSDLAPSQKKTLRDSVDGAFEIAGQVGFLRKIPELRSPEEAKRVGSAFNTLASLYERSEGWAQALSAEADAMERELALLTASRAGLALESARNLGRACAFERAEGELANVRAQAIRECGTLGRQYRRVEKDLRCYREWVEQAKATEVWNHATRSFERQRNVEDPFKAGLLTDDLRQLEAEILEQMRLYDQSLEPQPFQATEKDFRAAFDEYEAVQGRAEAFFAARRTAEMCGLLPELQTAARRLATLCPATPFTYRDRSLRPPDELVADLNGLTRMDSQSRWAVIDRFDRALADCDRQGAAEALSELANADTRRTMFVDGACTPAEPGGTFAQEVESRRTRLAELEERIEEALDRFNRLVEQEQAMLADPCRFDLALDPSDLAALRRAARDACIDDADRYVAELERQVEERTAAADETLATMKRLREELSEHVDRDADPKRCGIDEARRVLAEIEALAETLRCPSDGTPSPSFAAGARWTLAQSEVHLTDFERREVDRLERDLQAGMAALQNGLEAVRAEPDCREAERLLEDVEDAVKEVAACPEYADDFAPGLQAIRTAVDGKRETAVKELTRSLKAAREARTECSTDLDARVQALAAATRPPLAHCLEDADLETARAEAEAGRTLHTQLKTSQATIESLLEEMESDLAACRLDDVAVSLQRARTAMPESPCDRNHAEFVRYGERLGNMASRLGSLRDDVDQRRTRTLLAVRTAEAYVRTWNHRVEWDASRTREYERAIGQLRPVGSELRADATLRACLDDLLADIDRLLGQAVPPPAPGADAPQDAPLPAVATTPVGSDVDCSSIPGARRVYSPADDRFACVCPDGSQVRPGGACAERVAALDCGRYPGSRRVYDPASGELVCVCPDGSRADDLHPSCAGTQQTPPPQPVVDCSRFDAALRGARTAAQALAITRQAQAAGCTPTAQLLATIEQWAQQEQAVASEHQHQQQLQQQQALFDALMQGFGQILQGQHGSSGGSGAAANASPLSGVTLPGPPPGGYDPLNQAGTTTPGASGAPAGGTGTGAAAAPQNADEPRCWEWLGGWNKDGRWMPGLGHSSWCTERVVSCGPRSGTSVFKLRNTCDGRVRCHICE